MFKRTRRRRGGEEESEGEEERRRGERRRGGEGYPGIRWESMSIGRGKIIVEFFSAEMELSVWREQGTDRSDWEWKFKNIFHLEHSDM